jgi:hypothetical protein
MKIVWRFPFRPIHQIKTLTISNSDTQPQIKTVPAAESHLSTSHRSANSMSMNLRRAVALTLVGWSLMFPSRGGNKQSRVGSPLSSWYNGKTFSSMAECEDAIRNMVDMIKQPNIRAAIDARLKRAAHPPITSSQWDEFSQDLASSRCVASEDPRLKAK